MRGVSVVGCLVVWFLVCITDTTRPSAGETTGQVTEFALPIANSGYPPKPDGIAAGPTEAYGWRNPVSTRLPA
jgi:hypothetical protein